MSDLRDASALFDGERLTLARQLAGLRKSDLAALVRKSATAVAAWETGAKRPTPSTVAELALGLGVSPGFFAARGRSSAATHAVPHFRSLRSTTQLARDQAFAYGRVAADVAGVVERHVEFPEPQVPVFPVAVDASGDEPEEAARAVRQAWGFAEGPVGHLVRMVENHGVLVVFSPGETSSVDAYSFDSIGRPVVILNPLKNDYYRQRFDVAHELGHLVMHHDAEPGSRIIEEQANRFASELLMPAAQIADLLPTTMSGNGWRTLAKLKEDWGVSMQALLFRARALGRLSDVSYRNAMMTVSARGWRRSEPGMMTTVEQPSLLPGSIRLLETEAGLSIETLIDQARVPAELFDTVVSRTPRAPETVAEPTEQRRIVSLLPGTTRRESS